VLLTKAAIDRIPPEAGIRAGEMQITIAGATMPVFRIEYRG
jgi:hypothetical protein